MRRTMFPAWIAWPLYAVALSLLRAANWCAGAATAFAVYQDWECPACGGIVCWHPKVDRGLLGTVDHCLTCGVCDLEHLRPRGRPLPYRYCRKQK